MAAQHSEMDIVLRIRTSSRTPFIHSWAVLNEGESMKKLLVLTVAVAMVGIGGCASIGKGKGKAPPPAASPIVTKG
jgi:hypothetical protein